MGDQLAKNIPCYDPVIGSTFFVFVQSFLWVPGGFLQVVTWNVKLKLFIIHRLHINIFLVSLVRL